MALTYQWCPVCLANHNFAIEGERVRCVVCMNYLPYTGTTPRPEPMEVNEPNTSAITRLSDWVTRIDMHNKARRVKHCAYCGEPTKLVGGNRPKSYDPVTGRPLTREVYLCCKQGHVVATWIVLYETTKEIE